MDEALGGATDFGANPLTHDDNTSPTGSPGSECRIVNDANSANAVNPGPLQAGLSALANCPSAGIATAAALAMVPGINQGRPFAARASTINFQGCQGLMPEGSARVTQNLKVKLGGPDASDGGMIISGGMAYQW